MKLNKLLCLAAVVLAVNVQAQDLRIHVNDKGKVGFVDQAGNEVIKCQYESALPFSDGTAIVTKSGKSGIIDISGSVVLPLKYNQILPWNKELYLIKAGKKVGIANHKGEIVLPANYSFISKLNCYDRALIALGGKATANDKKTYMANAKYGIIDASGNILVSPKYKGLYEFTYDGTNIYPYYEGKCLAYSYHNTIDTLVSDCSYLGFSGSGNRVYFSGVMDGHGNELLAPGLFYFVMQPQNGMVRYYDVKKKETLCGYYNLDTNKSFQVATFNTIIRAINFWTHGDFIGDIAPVNGTSWSFIDKNGNVLRSGYSSIKHNQATELWAARNSSNTWDVFNDSNNDVASLSGYSNINFPFNEGDKEVFSVQKEDKYGCIKRDGSIVVPFEYEMAIGNTFDVIAVKKSGKWGLITADNTNLIPVEYTDVLLPSERYTQHLWVMKDDSLYYHMNLTTKRLSSTGYKVVHNFANGLAYVVPVGMKVDDTQVNRAQMFAPNTPKMNIDSLDMSKSTGAFVNIIDIDDNIVFDLPVSTLYMSTVKNELENRGGRKMSEVEKKNLLLDITRENRSYDLKSTLSEEEWNY